MSRGVPGVVLGCPRVKFPAQYVISPEKVNPSISNNPTMFFTTFDLPDSSRMTKKANDEKNKVPVALKLKICFVFFDLCVPIGVFFSGFCVFPAIILRPRGHSKSTKSGFGSGKLMGLDFGANLMPFWMLCLWFSQACLKMYVVKHHLLE